MDKIIVFVTSVDEEWEQIYMPSKCLKCRYEFELDTEELDLDAEDPLVQCPNCEFETTMTLVESFPQEEKFDIK